MPGIQTKTIGGVVYNCPEPSYLEARKLQLLAVKVLGPVIALSGALEQDIDPSDMSGLGEMGMSNLGEVLSKATQMIDPDEMLGFLHTCCERAYNTKAKRYVDPELDFSPHNAEDIEVAAFVLKVQCGPFMTGLLRKTLGGEGEVEAEADKDAGKTTTK